MPPNNVLRVGRFMLMYFWISNTHKVQSVYAWTTKIPLPWRPKKIKGKGQKTPLELITKGAIRVEKISIFEINTAYGKRRIVVKQLNDIDIIVNLRLSVRDKIDGSGKNSGCF